MYIEKYDLANIGGGAAAFAAATKAVMLGLLEAREHRAASTDATVADVMRPRPTTVMANEPLQALVERMKQAGVGGNPVTAPERRLLGFLVRQECEHALQEEGHRVLGGGAGGWRETLNGHTITLSSNLSRFLHVLTGMCLTGAYGPFLIFTRWSGFGWLLILRAVEQ